MASSSRYEPCSTDRAPARIARLAPSAPWAWTATKASYQAASSTAARSSASVSSGAPGTPPRVRTAPVARHLMRSAPPMSSRRTRSRTSSTERTTPKRRASGSSMSWARPTTSPPPHGAVMYAPAACIRGPTTSPRSMASRSAQHVNARNEPTSRTVVNPASIVWRAWRTPMSASSAPDVSVDGTPAVWTSPTRWVCVSMSPGRANRSPRSTTARAIGDAVRGGRDGRDPPVVADVDDALALDLAGLDVEQPPDADGRRHATLMRASGRRSGRTAARAGCARAGVGR